MAMFTAMPTWRTLQAKWRDLRLNFLFITAHPLTTLGGKTVQSASEHEHGRLLSCAHPLAAYAR